MVLIFKFCNKRKLFAQKKNLMNRIRKYNKRSSPRHHKGDTAASNESNRKVLY